MVNSLKILFTLLFTFLFCLIPSTVVAAPLPKITNHYIKLNDDLNLFYQDSGQGQVLLFIPGWTMSSDVFRAQVNHFNKNYRVIAIDPRSQGRSSLTLDNNNYNQHGKDLARFIALLGLKKVTLVGWSWGCNDAYSYIRQQGVDNLKAFVCIDSSPKTSGKPNEWAFVDYQGWGAFLQPLIYDRIQFLKSWPQSMVERKLQPAEQDWIAQQSLRTPTYAALELALDAIYSDYRPEAILLNTHQIPTLDVVSEYEGARAKQWLQANAPHTKINVMGKHMMFWEHPDAFNQLLDGFLNGMDNNKPKEKPLKS